MLPRHLSEALRDFKEGKIDEEKLSRILLELPYQDLSFAKVDHHRSLRQGFPEVVFGRGKSAPQVVEIAEAVLSRDSNLVVTCAPEGVFEKLKATYPEARFHTLSRALTVLRDRKRYGRGRIGILTAGTADIPVAEEALVTAEAMGNQVASSFDVGVAGIHRILKQREWIRSCTVLVVVAGMEGALPSVVGGLVDVPVIAVPTSVGYGASLGGIAALLGMLNSCAANVTVVNIDNGFGAGYVASLINRKRTSS